MPDQIGRITVPEIVPSGTFPIVPDAPWGRALAPDVYIHLFANPAANLKIEQRFLAGDGATRYVVRCAGLPPARRVALCVGRAISSPTSWGWYSLG